jgi:hypothetical protein
MKLVFILFPPHFTWWRIYCRYSHLWSSHEIKYLGICNNKILTRAFSSCQYYIFAYVDAPAYQILKNLNIISTGVLYRIILKKK